MVKTYKRKKKLYLGKTKKSGLRNRQRRYKTSKYKNN